ncbi:MAG: hypothetical protein ACYC21_07495 [Eubacteriales bacterium]
MFFHDPLVAKYQAKAFWGIVTKYSKILLASIFAMVLAKPEITTKKMLNYFPLNKIVFYYFLIAGLGLFFIELLFSLMDNAEPDEKVKILFGYEAPEFIRLIGSVFFISGLFLFAKLFSIIINLS